MPRSVPFTRLLESNPPRQGRRSCQSVETLELNVDWGHQTSGREKCVQHPTPIQGKTMPTQRQRSLGNQKEGRRRGTPEVHATNPGEPPGVSVHPAERWMGQSELSIQAPKIIEKAGTNGGTTRVNGRVHAPKTGGRG